MDKSIAQRVVSQTFKAAYDRHRFCNFVNELTNGFDETKKQTTQIPDAKSWRYSYLVGAEEEYHTAQARFLGRILREELVGSPGRFPDSWIQCLVAAPKNRTNSRDHSR